MFRDMNEAVEDRIAFGPPRRKKRSPETPSDTNFKARSEGGEMVGVRREEGEDWKVVKRESGEKLRMRNELSTDWKDQALNRFFADYVIETEDLYVSPGFLDKLPSVYGKMRGGDSVLEQAMASVSLSNFGNQVGSMEMLIQARKSYGRGLKLLHQTLIKGGMEMSSDGVLGGMLLLNMYEVR